MEQNTQYRCVRLLCPEWQPVKIGRLDNFEDVPKITFYGHINISESYFIYFIFSKSRDGGLYRHPVYVIYFCQITVQPLILQ